MSLLEIESLRIEFPGEEDERLVAVKGVDLAIEPGETEVRTRPLRRDCIDPVAGRIGNARHQRDSTLPFSVSKVLPPFFILLASGNAADDPNTSLRLGPAAAGPPP